MTMPHLMNCGHSPDSWCLDCVKQMHDEYERKLTQCQKQRESGRIVDPKTGKNDGSMWKDTIMWHDATHSTPVPTVALVRMKRGFESVSSDGQKLGWHWSNQVAIIDLHGLSHEQVAAKFLELDAEWWAYVPSGPPANVHPVSWTFDADGNPITHHTKDPKKLNHVYNVPAVIIGQEVLK